MTHTAKVDDRGLSASATAGRLTVFGAGYLGVTHAAAMAELGHRVLVVDTDELKLAKLSGGEVPFFEPGLQDMVLTNIASGRLSFTDSYTEAADFATVHFIGVGTPQKNGENGADLRQVEAVITELAPLLTGPCVIIGKSTVPVGTAKRLLDLTRQLSPAGDEVELVWSPEFLREGRAIADTLHPDRIVLGLDADHPKGRAEAVFREVYADILADGMPVLVTDLATAELVKVAANAFLATKISFINAIADVCDSVGADVGILADALGHDERIGRRFLDAGVGFGGGCLPKDLRAFRARAGELGVDLTLLRDVDEINLGRRERVVELALEAVGGSFAGSKVAVLGAAFKPQSDDVRDSPALNVAGQVHLKGAHVSVYDPIAMDNSRLLFPTLTYAPSAEDAVAGADVVLVLTEWAEFTTLDPKTLGGTVRGKVVVDGRNCLDRDRWKSAGWRYIGMGRS